MRLRCHSRSATSRFIRRQYSLVSQAKTKNVLADSGFYFLTPSSLLHLSAGPACQEKTDHESSSLLRKVLENTRQARVFCCCIVCQEL